MLNGAHTHTPRPGMLTSLVLSLSRNVTCNCKSMLTARHSELMLIVTMFLYSRLSELKALEACTKALDLQSSVDSLQMVQSFLPKLT